MNSLLKVLAIPIFIALVSAPARADISTCHTEDEVTAYYARYYNATVVGRLSGDILKHFMAKFSELLAEDIAFTSEYMLFYNVPDKKVYGFVGYKDNCYNQEKGFIAPDKYHEIMQNVFAEKNHLIFPPQGASCPSFREWRPDPRQGKNTVPNVTWVNCYGSRKRPWG